MNKRKVLYLECKTGAAGDMLMGALFDLLDEENKKLFLDKLNGIHPDIQVMPKMILQKGIGGTHMEVKVLGIEEDTDEPVRSPQRHTSYGQILEEIKQLDMSPRVRHHAAKIFTTIGEAESRVHGTKVDQIHFRQVGTLDAFVDVVGCCLAMDLLDPQEIQASPVCVGSGTVRCPHGLLPVPAPATAEIIQGMPVYPSTWEGEMLTPTGAAILKHFVQTYTSRMVMTLNAVGYGMGTREFPYLSSVRAFWGCR